MFIPIQDVLVGPPAQGSHFFSVENAFKFLKEQKPAMFDDVPGQKVLIYPTAPSTWLYFAKNDGDTGFNADKYRWRNKSVSPGKVNIAFRRYFICVKNNEEQNTGKKVCTYDVGFQRNVYHLSHPVQKGDPILIAYRGDHTIFKLFPHGNATLKTNFIATVQSVKLEVQKSCRSVPSVERLFDETKADQTANLGGINHCQLIVRDPKQIANYRAREKKSYIISPCQLTSLHLLSMYHLEDFIHSCNTIPEFYCILAEPEAIKLANKLLNESENNPSIDQVVNYDTTFEMGEFYLSTLVIKNTHIKQNRMLPVAFFMHNRKTTLTHKAFFDWVFNVLDIPATVPFVTDREESIVANILGHPVGPRQLFYCSIHIARDVKTWCQTQKIGKKRTDRIVKQIKNLIGKNSLDDFDKALETISVDWSPHLFKYFNDNIKPPLLSNLTNKIEGQFAHFETKSITTNLSESWHNKLQKQFNKAEKDNMRIDYLAAHLFKIQASYLDEYNRAIENEGRRFTLKEEAYATAVKAKVNHANLKVVDMMRDAKEFAKTLPNNYFVEDSQNAMEEDLAELVAKLDLITYKAKFESYFVAHPFDVQDVYQVILNKGK